MKAFRIFHLAIALGATTAYFTAEELGLVHAWLGYAIAALVAIRLALGLARANGFSFRRVIPRLGTPPLGQTGLRHPAIAQALTLALLVTIGGAASTGIAMDKGGTLVGQSIRAHDGERGEGREREEDEDFSLINPVATAYADDGERGERGGEGEEHGLLGELHETFGNLLLPLAVLHALYLLATRFEMARFMLFMPRRRAA